MDHELRRPDGCSLGGILIYFSVAHAMLAGTLL
jgi:hypothetical protein